MKKIIILLFILVKINCISQREACDEQRKRNQSKQTADDCIFYNLITGFLEDTNGQNLTLEQVNSQKKAAETFKLYFAQICIKSELDNQKCQTKSKVLPNF